MDDALISLLYQIRTLLFISSVVLAVGCFCGLLYKGRVFEKEEPKDVARPRSAYKKRRLPRVKSDSIIELKDSSGAFIPGTAYLHDISPEGACFDSRWVFTPGKKIEARLHSSKEGVIHISAKIIWSTPLRHTILYGVQFQKMKATKAA